MALNARLKKLEALAHWLEWDGQLLKIELLLKIAEVKERINAREAAERAARAAEEKRRAAEEKRWAEEEKRLAEEERRRKATAARPPEPPAPPSPPSGVTSPDDGAGKVKAPPAPPPMRLPEPFQPLHGRVRWVPVGERTYRRYDDDDP